MWEDDLRMFSLDKLLAYSARFAKPNNAKKIQKILFSHKSIILMLNVYFVLLIESHL